MGHATTVLVLLVCFATGNAGHPASLFVRDLHRAASAGSGVRDPCLHRALLIAATQRGAASTLPTTCAQSSNRTAVSFLPSRLSVNPLALHMAWRLDLNDRAVSKAFSAATLPAASVADPEHAGGLSSGLAVAESREVGCSAAGLLGIGRHGAGQLCPHCAICSSFSPQLPRRPCPR